ncbi:hypothetical protein HZS_7349 [Henneguya salminicola]|nr:hypothetical protein HZS_7349 [Henneguya salminicola]
MHSLSDINGAIDHVRNFLVGKNKKDWKTLYLQRWKMSYCQNFELDSYTQEMMKGSIQKLISDPNSVFK